MTTDDERPKIRENERRETPKWVLRDADGGGPRKKEQNQPPPSHYDRACLCSQPVDKKTRDCPHDRSD